MNENHEFLLILKSKDENGEFKTISSRSLNVVEYNKDIIYSLKLNKLMKDMCSLVEEALRDNDIERIYSTHRSE